MAIFTNNNGQPCNCPAGYVYDPNSDLCVPDAGSIQVHSTGVVSGGGGAPGVAHYYFNLSNTSKVYPAVLSNNNPVTFTDSNGSPLAGYDSVSNLPPNLLFSNIDNWDRLSSRNAFLTPDDGSGNIVKGQWFGTNFTINETLTKGQHIMTIAGAGYWRIWIDGQLVVDIPLSGGMPLPTRVSVGFFFALNQGCHDVLVEYYADPNGSNQGAFAVSIISEKDLDPNDGGVQSFYDTAGGGASSWGADSNGSCSFCNTCSYSDDSAFLVDPSYSSCGINTGADIDFLHLAPGQPNFNALTYLGTDNYTGSLYIDASFGCGDGYLSECGGSPACVNYTTTAVCETYYVLTDCNDPNNVLSILDTNITLDTNLVYQFAEYPGVCFSVALSGTSSGTVVSSLTVQNSYADCNTCSNPANYYILTDCNDPGNVLSILDTDITLDTNLIYQFNEYPGVCFSVALSSSSSGTVVSSLTIQNTYADCNTCLNPTTYYILTDCSNPGNVISIDTSLITLDVNSIYKFVEYPGVCFSVTTGSAVSGTEVTSLTVDSSHVGCDVCAATMCYAVTNCMTGDVVYVTSGTVLDSNTIYTFNEIPGCFHGAVFQNNCPDPSPISVTIGKTHASCQGCLNANAYEINECSGSGSPYDGGIILSAIDLSLSLKHSFTDDVLDPALVDPNNPFSGFCFTLSPVTTWSAPIGVVKGASQDMQFSDCAACYAPPYYKLTNCSDPNEVLYVEYASVSLMTGSIYSFDEYPDKCWTVEGYHGTPPSTVTVTPSTTDPDCNACLQRFYKYEAKRCFNYSETVYISRDASLNVGSFYSFESGLDGCWVITGFDLFPGETPVSVTNPSEFETCDECCADDIIEITGLPQQETTCALQLTDADIQAFREKHQKYTGKFIYPGCSFEDSIRIICNFAVLVYRSWLAEAYKIDVDTSRFLKRYVEHEKLRLRSLSAGFDCELLQNCCTPCLKYIREVESVSYQQDGALGGGGAGTNPPSSGTKKG